MNFTFENQGTRTYLVYKVAEDDTIDSMSLGMITNNKIPGLAQTIFSQMDTTKFIKYDVSSKVSVNQFFAGQVNKKRLVGVFNGIVDAMLSSEDYMIDVNSILLDLDYIFADVSTCETVLVCLPIMSDELKAKDPGAFFKSIMFTTQFDQTENCDHVAKIINYLNSSPVFSLMDFKKLLENIDTAPSYVQPQVQLRQQSAPIQPPRAQPVQQQKPIVQQPVQQQRPTPQQPPVQQPPVQQPPVQQPPVQQPPVQQPPVQQPPVQQRPMQQQSPAPQQPPMQQRPMQQQPPIQQRPMQQQPPQNMPSEKKMTMMGLLTHYNKENAAMYKQQKAAQKAIQSGAAVPPPVQQTKKPQPQVGFEIPGQPTTINQTATAPNKQPQTPPMPQQQTMPVGAQRPIAQNQTKPTPAPTPTPAPAPTYTQPQMPSGRSGSFGETTVLNEGGASGETTVLGATAMTQAKPHLVRSKTGEKIDLNKPVFRIGKEKSYVDYFVGDNSAISRSHANIIIRDGDYFILDTNSTNHTFVNGQMIQSNVETKLTHGTAIRLANEEFEFKLY